MCHYFKNTLCRKYSLFTKDDLKRSVLILGRRVLVLLSLKDDSFTVGKKL